MDLARMTFLPRAAITVETIANLRRTADAATPAETTAADERGGDGELEGELTRLAEATLARGAVWDDPSWLTLLKGGASTEPAARTEIPRARRWEIFFPEGVTAAEYAAQLDVLGIELGVIGDGQIEYARNVSKPMPEKRVAPAAEEHRMYMSSRRGGLAEADRHLAAMAGVDTAGKLVVQFFSEAIEQQLAELEKSYAGREPAAIQRTRFSVRAKPGGYEYYVVQQVPLR